MRRWSSSTRRSEPAWRERVVCQRADHRCHRPGDDGRGGCAGNCAGADWAWAGDATAVDYPRVWGSADVGGAGGASGCGLGCRLGMPARGVGGAFGRFGFALEVRWRSGWMLASNWPITDQIRNPAIADLSCWPFRNGKEGNRHRRSSFRVRRYSLAVGARSPEFKSRRPDHAMTLLPRYSAGSGSWPGPNLSLCTTPPVAQCS